MDCVTYRGIDFYRDNDGLLYRSMEVKGETYEVPMNTMRKGNAWLVRFRKDYGNVKKSFSDGCNPHLSAQERTRQALAKAISFIRENYSHVHDEIFKSLSDPNRAKCTGIPGLSWFVTYSKPNKYALSPMVTVFATYNRDRKARIPNSAIHIDLFHTSEDEFSEKLRKVAFLRACTEQLTTKRNTSPRLTEDDLAKFDESSLLSETDFSVFTLPKVISIIEKDWEDITKETNQTLTFENSDQIMVQRVMSASVSNPQSGIFHHKHYEDIETARRLAKLYEKHLASSNPVSLSL